MKDKTNVAIVGLADGPNAGAGVGVAACLDADRFVRFGILGHRNESGAMRSDLVDHMLLLPPVEDPGFGAALGQVVCAKGIEYFLPGSTAAARALSQASAALKSVGARAIAPSFPALDKATGTGTWSLARSAGIRAVERNPAPLSPTDPLLTLMGSTTMLLIGSNGDCRRAQDPWDAVRARESLAKHSAGVSLADCSPKEHFEVAVLLDSSSKTRAACCVRVLADDMNARPWMVSSIENKTLLDQAMRFAQATGLSGPLRLHFTRRGLLFHVVDWQPGFPSWIELTHTAGPDLVPLSLQDVPADATPDCTPANLLFTQTAEDFAFLPPEGSQ